MAFNDWDGDGKITGTDDFLEYMIYQDVTGSSDFSGGSNYRRGNYQNSQKAQNAALERKLRSIGIPDTPDFQKLREKYSDNDIRAMIQMVTAPQGTNTMHTHSHMVSWGYIGIMWLSVIIAWLPLIFFFVHEDTSSLLMIVISVADLFYMIKIIPKIVKNAPYFKPEYRELYREVFKAVNGKYPDKDR